MANQYDPQTGQPVWQQAPMPHDPQPPQPTQVYYTVPPEGFVPPEGYPQKSRLAAGILAMLCGSLGIHNFYLGFQQRAMTQLLLTLVGSIFTCGITAIAMMIWGIVEGVRILEHRSNIDVNGVRLKD